LVPPALALLTTLLLGAGALASLPDVLARVALWKAILWGYLALSCAQAAFPSPGDRIGVLGAIALAVLVSLAVGAIEVLGGTSRLTEVLGAVVGLLALPAAAALVMLVALGASGRARR
ncbi:MAG TPA: hypothetical protein VGN69_00420, partial [Solirubrobacteraceae bacterium]|nr:hypothetical protein [Solirubrobacteraceae bacterium]